MANASVELVCSWCGETFYHEKISRNREDANSYEAWAQDNISLCPKCYSKRMKQDELRKCEEKIGNLELAPLYGTGKQVAWVNEIRTQMVALLVGKSQDVSDDMWEAINRFSVALRNEIQNAKSVPFNRNDYERAINDVYRHYSTEDLVKMSRARCAI